MKKIFYLASIAALALSSCAKDETTGAIVAVNGGKITAAVEADDTRTYLENVDGKYQFRWKATDALYVYGDEKHPLPGETFTIGEGAETATAVFNGVTLKQGAKYVATYPAKTSVKPEWDVPVENAAGQIIDYALDPSTVKMSIPAEQNYKPGSFDTGVAPAISKSFTVDADGNAQVSMQPVADYLFVNIRGTEPIESLTLRLTTSGGGKTIGLAGEGALVEYSLDKTTRYYLPNTGMKGDITLNAIAASEVDCHEPNTYVFTIPAGILGMGNSVCAYLFVNKAPNTDGTNWSFAAIDYTIGEQYMTGKKIVDNYLINQYEGKNEAGKTVDMNRAWNKSKLTAEKPMENTVFWMNTISVDTDGDNVADSRGSFLYNPSGSEIITNQIELLNYMENYEAGQSAFICNDAEFDFSKAALDAIATEYREAGYEFVNDLVNNYYAYGFPCIENFKDSFVGNGAVISNVAKLASMDGIFGEIDGTISGVTFENITSKNVTLKNEGKKDEYEETTYGVILGTDAKDTAATIKDVVVSGGSGEAVMAEGSSANYAGITFENVSEDLNHIFGNVNVAAPTQSAPAFDLSNTWAEVSNVACSVFKNVTPAGTRAIINITAEDATYAQLTDKVVNSQSNVASVVINGVSYWTGGKTNVGAVAYKVNNAAVGQYIQYAEELAYGYTTMTYAVLARNIDLNFENLQWYDEDGDLIDYTAWETAKFNTLIGAGNTVKGVVMFDGGSKASEGNRSVAPFELNVAKNITIDGVSINLVSKQDNTYVPQWIAGLSISATELDGVTVNNLEILAGDADEMNAPQYKWHGFVGYLVANATNIKVSNSAINGVYSNVKGTAAPVAHLEVTNTNAQMLNNTLTGVELDGGQTEVDELTQDVKRNMWNVSSDTFGRVWGHSSNDAAVGIKFDGYSNIAFTYNAENPIVIYDLDSNDDNVVLKNE